MWDCNPVSTPLDTSIKLCSIMENEPSADLQEYASIVRGLTFVAYVTRPNIACAVCQLSQFLNNSSTTHMYVAKWVLRYLQGIATLGITYQPPLLQLQRYSDMNWAGDMDTKWFTMGYIVMLNNGMITWKSHRQPTVALSTMESEYMALTDAIKKLKWVRTLLADLSYSNRKSNEPIELYSDNQDVIALAKNPVSSDVRWSSRTREWTGDLPAFSDFGSSSSYNSAKVTGSRITTVTLSIELI